MTRISETAAFGPLLAILAGMSLLGAGMAACAQAPWPSDSELDRLHSPGFDACLKRSPAMSSLRHCDSLEAEYQQAALDREFKALLAARPAERVWLEADQQRWTEQTNGRCSAYLHRRGSMNSLGAMGCFRAETAKRRLYMEAALQTGELPGD